MHISNVYMYKHFEYNVENKYQLEATKYPCLLAAYWPHYLWAVMPVSGITENRKHYAIRATYAAYGGAYGGHLNQMEII